MSDRYRLAIAQMNPTVGAFEANRTRIVRMAEQAWDTGARMLLFPELALCGYPPEDLILKPHFVDQAELELEKLASQLPPELVCVVGTVTRGEQKPRNAAAVIAEGKVAASYAKRHLPNYGVFDEQRLFEPGDRPLVIQCSGNRIAVQICEDAWFPEDPILDQMSELNLSALLNLSASPFHRGKGDERHEMLRRTSAKIRAPLVYCNQVGGQDELVFDGGSMFLGADGQALSRAKRFSEDLIWMDLPVLEGVDALDSELPLNVEWVFLSGEDRVSVNPPPPPVPSAPDLEPLEEVYEALCLGLRDYTEKNGFHEVLVAISGGIDSALVAALAVSALGPSRVFGVTLPTRYSSEETQADAQSLAASLGIEMSMLPIQALFEEFQELLQPQWEGYPEDVTEENLQSRIRGTLVMALSNKFKRLVLATGNKSEMATGYATLYGDMNGGFALIKDVPKTLVFDLCSWINQREGRELIPQSILERPPSAELREGQRDSDSLPPYPVLDRILQAYIEEDLSREQIVAEGFEQAMVTRVMHMVDRNEYKRRQAPPGIKITPKAFGRDRRVPLTHHFVAI